HHTPAAVARAAGGERGPDMRSLQQALWTWRGGPVSIVARKAYLQKTASVTDRYGLLLQASHHAVTHFSSRAKKADAFFSRLTSSRSCRFSTSSCRIRCCSAVNGLPTPA